MTLHAPSVDDPRLNRFAFWLCAVIVFLQAYVVPANPASPGLDGSFPHILNLATFASEKFGRDIIYTYGPFGFLLQAEDIGLHLGLAYAFWTVTYACFALTVAYIVVSRTTGWSLVAAIVFAGAVASFVDPDRLLTCFVMLLLFIGYDHPRIRTSLIFCCGIMAAFGLLMKVTIGVGCMGSIFASLLFPLRAPIAIVARACAAIVAIGATLYIGWTVATGSPDGLGPYFYTSSQMSQAYTAVMSHGRPREAISLTFFLTAMASLIVFAVKLPRGKVWHSLAVIGPSVAIAWKHGVVRYDGHVASLVIVLVFSTFCVACLHRNLPGNTAKAAPDRPTVSIYGSIAVLFLTATGLITAHLIDGTRYSGGLLAGLAPLSKLMTFGAYRQGIARESEARHVNYRLSPELLGRIGDKTIDAYTYDLGFVAANPQLHWRLKPVFQHFNAFTDYLDTQNARFLAAEDAPHFLLTFQDTSGSMAGVDERHQLFDDPIAFPEIIRNYHIVYTEQDPSKPQIGLLERQPNDRFASPRIVSTQNGAWNTAIPLPDTGTRSLLRARVELTKTRLAAIEEMLFRLPEIYIAYVFVDGSEKKYRLIPPHLKSGVLVSPLFETYTQFHHFLAGKEWSGAKVAAIRFETQRPGDYAFPFTISWEAIDCHGDAPCSPTTSRFYARGSDGINRTPVMLTAPLDTSITSPAAEIRTIEVRLSTYARISKGTLTIDVLGDRDETLAHASIDAADVKDNGYAPFNLDAPLRVPAGKVRFRLSYIAQPGGTIAAWLSSGTASDFDLRLYGETK
ncbi:MAG: hypothetical protein ABWY18_08030 [Tardiphaga sp.]